MTWSERHGREVFLPAPEGKTDGEKDKGKDGEREREGREEELGERIHSFSSHAPREHNLHPGPASKWRVWRNILYLNHNIY